MSQSPSLAQLQQWMHWILSDRRGVARSLAEPLPSVKNIHRMCEAAVCEQPPISREARLGIYSFAYFERLADVLASDFTLVDAILGREKFRELVADYLERFPSTSRNVSEVGRHLGAFTREHRFLSSFPYLSELASLEWAGVEAFHASDLPPFDTSALASVPEDGWEHVSFTLDASLQLFEFAWPLDRLWLTPLSELPEVATTLAPTPTYLVLFRSEWKPCVKSVEKLPFLLLHFMQQGLSLGAICEATHQAMNLETDLTAVSAGFGQWFADWIAEGWVRGISSPTLLN